MVKRLFFVGWIVWHVSTLYLGGERNNMGENKIWCDANLILRDDEPLRKFKVVGLKLKEVALVWRNLLFAY